MHPSPPQVTRQGVAFRTKSSFHTETASFFSTPYFIVYLLILMGLSIIWIISTAELNPLFAQPLLWSIFHLHLCYRRRLIPMKCINQTSLLLSFQLNSTHGKHQQEIRGKEEKGWGPFVPGFLSNNLSVTVIFHQRQPSLLQPSCWHPPALSGPRTNTNPPPTLWQPWGVSSSLI